LGHAGRIGKDRAIREQTLSHCYCVGKLCCRVAVVGQNGKTLISAVSPLISD